MVISSVNTVTYNGDGITKAWPFTFSISDATEIKLQLVHTDGTYTAITSDYYVDTVNSTVYYPGYAPGAEPPTAEQPPNVQTGEKIEVYREVPMTQEADLGEAWPFYVIEKGLDKLTMICQQINSGFFRTLDAAVASMFQLAGIVTDSGKLQHITDQYNAIDANAATASEKATAAANSATAAANSATAAANSATSAANSYNQADTVATALTDIYNDAIAQGTIVAPAVDATLAVAGAAADAKVTGDKINTLNRISSNVFNLVPYQTASNWCLTGTGTSRSYTGCNLVKYKVVEGQTLFLSLSKDTDATNAQGVYQFQNNSSVPSNNNSYLIGAPVTVATNGEVTVPTGATYLIVSQLSTNKTNIVMDESLNLAATAAQAKFALNATIQPVWNVSSGGISINGSTVHVNTDGFGVKFNGSIYYIAPTDNTTEYDFTASAGNQFLVIDKTKLTNAGGRQDPDVVMSLKTVSNLTDNDIPVAYSFYYAFDFVGVFRQFRDTPTNASMNAAIEVATAGASALNANFLQCMVGSHAGSSNETYALNCMLGYKAAISNGDRLVEGDVRFSSDLIPVMFHDETLSSTNIAGWTGDTIYVGAKTYAELQEYDLIRSSGKIPKLEDFLILCKKFGVIAEIDLAGKTFKSDADTEIITQADMLAAIVALIQKLNMDQSVVLTLSATQARTLMTITGKYPVSISNMTTTSAIAGISDIVASFPLTFCSIGTSYTSEIMSAIRQHGTKCRAKAWTLDTLADVESAFDSGVAYVLSNAVTQNSFNEHTLDIV